MPIVKKDILIIKHIDIEGPGTLGYFLKERQEPFRIVDLGAGEPLPQDPSLFQAIICLGGPMNVYEENKYPFLKFEHVFIQKVLQQGVPYLGLCLGSQLLAKAAGALVVRSPVKEIGWYTVRLTEEGCKDPLFRGFRESQPVYHWHGDMFHIPDSGRLLVMGDGCPHQALRVGENAYGLQFHVEVTDTSLREWCAAYSAVDLPSRQSHAQSMRDDYRKYQKDFDAQAYTLYANFLQIVSNARENIQRF